MVENIPDITSSMVKSNTNCVHSHA